MTADMTLEQLAAQVLVIGFPAGDEDLPNSPVHALLDAGGLGGVILFAGNVGTAESVRTLTGKLRQFAADAGAPPLLVCVDQEGGPVRRLRDGVPNVPSARSLGTESDPSTARILAEETGRALLSLGVNTNFAPVADVVDDPKSFLYERSYDGQPRVVSAFVRAVVEGYQAAGILSAAKHFPGHGATAQDTHTGTPTARILKTVWEERHLPPFRAAIDAGVPLVMVSHVAAPALGSSRPASQAPELIDGVLRASLGFEGVVVSDDLAMAAAGEVPKAAVASLRAGADLLVLSGPGDVQMRTHARIVAAVREGVLPEERLRQAATQVLKAKRHYGLLPGNDAP